MILLEGARLVLSPMSLSDCAFPVPVSANCNSGISSRNQTNWCTLGNGPLFSSAAKVYLVRAALK